MGFIVLRRGAPLPAKAADDALSRWRLLTSGVLPLLVTIVSAALLGLRHFGESRALGWRECTLALVADPPAQIVRPAALLSVRFLRLAVVFAVLAASYMDEGIEIEPEGSKGIKVRIWGAGRLATFTVWCWTLQGVYFALASYCFFLLPPSSAPEHNDFSLLAAVALVLFETNLATSILVTVVVSFVLFPHAMKSSVDTNYNLLCRPAALMMHNANVIFMVGELLLTGMPVYLSHFAFGVLLGCAYVVFAWVWYARVGMFFYFFLCVQCPASLAPHSRFCLLTSNPHSLARCWQTPRKGMQLTHRCAGGRAAITENVVQHWVRSCCWSPLHFST
jgi:hypothetical protein